MRLDFLPIGNYLDVVLENYHAASDPATPITDAVMQFTVYDSAGVAVAGCENVSMTHAGVGHYRGSAKPSTDLTSGTRYRVLVECTNYGDQWQQTFVARPRTFAA